VSSANDENSGRGWNKRAYCREHYFDYAFPRCDTCDGVLTGNNNIDEGQVSISNIMVGNSAYHPTADCFKCTTCEISLVSKVHGDGEEEAGVFSHMGKPFCDSCYLNQHASACDGCGGRILGDVVNTDIVVVGGGESSDAKRTLNYHPKCFHCVKCDVALEGTNKFTVQHDGANDVVSSSFPFRLHFIFGFAAFSVALLLGVCYCNLFPFTYSNS
jgi:hypothetical protein